MKIKRIKKYNKETLIKNLKRLETDHNNLDLINDIAIGYLSVPEMCQNYNDLIFMEKAYFIKKTVKSCHNYSYLLYLEYDEIEKAFLVQKECIKLKPKSYAPYFLFGYILIQMKNYKEALKHLLKANKIYKDRQIMHNIGICYYKLNEFKNAKKFFYYASLNDDIQNKSNLALALTEYKLGNLEGTLEIAKKLNESINKKVDSFEHEIALLFFLLDCQDKAVETVLKLGIDGICLYDWIELLYSFYIIDYKKCLKYVNKGIKIKFKEIKSFKANDKIWNEWTEADKLNEIIKLENDISILNLFKKPNLSKPNLDVDSLLIVECPYCILFGCTQHGNLENDE